MYRGSYRWPQLPSRRMKPLAHYPFYFTGNLPELDRFGLPIGALADYVVLDWAASDGLTPYIGPVLTPTGTIADEKSPYNKPDSNNIISASFDSKQYDALSNIPVWQTTDDFYGFAIIRPDPEDLAASRNIFNIGHPGAGAESVTLRHASGGLQFVVRGDTTANAFLSSTTFFSKCWLFVQFLIDKSGNFTFFSNDRKSTDIASPAGSINSGASLSISGYQATAGAEYYGNIARVVLCAGATIADIASAGSYAYIYKMLNYATGVMNIKNTAKAVFNRDCVTSAVKNLKLFLYGYDTPASGSESIRLSAVTTNKCYRNINPNDTLGWTAIGAVTVTRIANDSSDLKSLGSVDCSDLGPAVIEIDNPTGAPGYAYNGATVGNLNKHSLQIRAKHVTGASGFKLGLYDAPHPGFHSGVEILDNYELTKNENITPIDTDCYLGFEIPAMQKLYVIGQQNEERSSCSALIVNYATGSSASRVVSTLDTGHTIDNAKGSVRFSIKIDGTVSGVRKIFSDPVLYLISTGNVLRFTDGTSQLNSTVNIADNNWHNVLISWGIPGMKIRVDNEVPVTGSFDGNIGFVSKVIIDNSVATVDLEIKNLRIYEDYQ